MATNIRAIVTIEKARATTSYIKSEVVASHQRSEAIATRSDFSINQWYYEDTGVVLSELHVTFVNKNIAESVELSEASILGLGLSKSETLSLVETFAREVLYQRSFTDAFTLDDAAQIDKDYYGVKGNVAFMLDVIGLSTAKIATDSYTVGDVYSAAVDKVVSENLSLIESFAKVVVWDRSFAHNFSMTETVDVGRSLNKSDSISFSDTYYATLSKIVTDSMTMTEVVGIGTGIPIAESFSISDSIISEINKVIADAFTLDDSTLIDKDYYGNKGNICTVSDVIALAITWVRGYSDSISTSDSANIANISGKVLNGASFNSITLN